MSASVTRVRGFSAPPSEVAVAIRAARPELFLKQSPDGAADFRFTTDSGHDIAGYVILEPAGQGCRVTLTLTSEAQGSNDLALGTALGAEAQAWLDEAASYLDRRAHGPRPDSVHVDLTGVVAVPLRQAGEGLARILDADVDWSRRIAVADSRQSSLGPIERHFHLKAIEGGTEIRAHVAMPHAGRGDPHLLQRMIDQVREGLIELMEEIGPLQTVRDAPACPDTTPGPRVAALPPPAPRPALNPAPARDRAIPRERWVPHL